MMDMSPGVNTVQSRRTLSGIVEQCKVISDDTCSESSHLRRQLRTDNG